MTLRVKNSYPLPKGLERILVRGKIGSKQHCSKCGRKFTPEFQDEDGFLCPEHDTRPTRYYIDGAPFVAAPVWHLYKDPKTDKVFKNYSDALDVWIALNREWKESEKKGIKFDPSDWVPAKLAEKKIDYLIGMWLRNYEVELDKGAKSKTRVHQLDVACKQHIKPHFGNIDIRDITRDAIEKFYHTLLDKKLSSRYIKDILDTLKALITRYAGKCPEMPGFVVVPAKEKQRLGYIREIAALDKAPTRHGYRIAILLLLRTGMRIGEACAVKVSDLIDGDVYVTKAISGDGLRLARKSGKPKSYHVTPELWSLLVEHVVDKGPDDYVFSIKGQYICPNRLAKVWRKACVDAGVKHISLQQASRHSTATEIKKKFDREAQEAIKEQLGHNNLSTQKHYIVE